MGEDDRDGGRKRDNTKVCIVTKNSEPDSRAVGRRCLSMALRIHERREMDPWALVSLACSCGEEDLAAAALGRQLERDHHWRLDLLALEHRICLDQIDAHGALEALISYKEPYEEGPECAGEPFFFYRILRSIESVIDAGLTKPVRFALNKAQGLLEEVDEKERPAAWAHLGSLMARCGMRKAANEAFRHAGPVDRWSPESEPYLPLRKARKHRLAAAYARNIARRARTEHPLGLHLEDRFAPELLRIAGNCVELGEHNSARRYLRQARHLYSRRPLVPKDRDSDVHRYDEYYVLHSIARLFAQTGDEEGLRRSLYASVGVGKRRDVLSRKPGPGRLTSEERLLLCHQSLAEASLVALEVNAPVFARELADKAMAGIELDRRIYVERRRSESARWLSALAARDDHSQLELPDIMPNRPTAEEHAQHWVPYFEADATAIMLAETYAELGEPDLVDQMLREVARRRNEYGRKSKWLYALEGAALGYLRRNDVGQARAALEHPLKVFLAPKTDSDDDLPISTFPRDVEWMALRLADEPRLDTIRNRRCEAALKEFREWKHPQAHELDHILDYSVVSGDLARAITIASDAHRDPSICEEVLAAALSMIAERLLTNRIPSITYRWSRGRHTYARLNLPKRHHIVTDDSLRGVDGRKLRRLEDVLDGLP